MVAGGPAGGQAALVALGDVAVIRNHLAEAERRAVGAARAAGRPWTEIAAVAGITRQAAWERWHDLDPTPPTAPSISLFHGIRPGVRRRPHAPMPPIDTVWARIGAHAGETFHQKRGRPFTYRIYGGCVLPDRTHRQIPRSHIAAALEPVPTASTVPLQHLQGPSYIWAILHDLRIRQADW